MKRSIIILMVVLVPMVSVAQSPDIEWQNTLGGDYLDWLFSAQPTPDGGYILGGSSASTISGNKTEPLIGNFDYWVVKVDSVGEMEWQNSLGGSVNDRLQDAKPTSDGGYILGGYSDSGAGFDKTESTIGAAGTSDYWIVKLDINGNIVWQNTIGGTANDILMSINQTIDGGYILGGYSNSPLSGDKTTGSFGLNDYWIVKTNAIGNIQWQITLGGTANDYFSSINQTSDGGYIINGSSSSGISGNKTEANLGVEDYWVIKLTSAGLIEWQNTIGGNCNDHGIYAEQTTDGGYIIGGQSCTDINGDKTEVSPALFSDYWILKLNSTGGIVWQNTIASDFSNGFAKVHQSTDGGYIIGGYSQSGMSYDKSEPSNGGSDFWVVKTDPSGVVEWDKTIGGSDHDWLFDVAVANDGGYILAGYSASGISGDKTENQFGWDDYWIVKLEPTCSPDFMELCNNIDDNCNGLIDEGVVETISISADGPTIFCSGNSVTLSAEYTGSSVQWTKNGINIPGATNSTYNVFSKGTYTCETSSDCGSASSNMIFVQVNKKPSAYIYADGPTMFCEGGSVTLNANIGGGLSYQWYKGTSPIAGANAISYNATTTGNYKCLITKMISGCSKQSNAIAISVPCKEAEQILENNISIYPNPASDFIVVDIENNNPKTIYLINAQGQSIQTLYSSEPKVKIDLTNLSAGLFYIVVEEEGYRYNQKFVKM